MIGVAIQNNGSLYWGDPVIIKITNAFDPTECINYQVIIRIEKVISQSETSLVSVDCFSPDVNGNIECDFSPFIRSAGEYKFRFGETYLSVINGEEGFWESYYMDQLDETIQLANGTRIETDYYSIPMGAVQLTGNPIQIIVPTAPELIAGKSSFKRLLKITCANLFGSPFIEEIAPDSNLVSKFDISGLVDQPVNYEFNFPAVGVISDHRALEFNVSIDTGETWLDADGIRQEHWNNLPATINTIRVLKGKLRSYELALLNEIGKNFNSEYINKGKFLTHLLNPQKVSSTQIVKLWYLSRFPSYVEAEWHCNVNQMTNYGPHTFSSLKGDIMLDPNSGLLEFNVNPIFMGHKASVTAEYPIFWYSFWLTRKSDSSVISEVRTFEVENDYYETSFTFLYVNPLSGIDCIRLTGEHARNLNASSETVFIPVPVGVGTKTASLKTVSVTGQQSWEINTGYKSKTEMISLRDFLESKDCWMMDPDNSSRLIPVLIEKDNFKLYDSSEDVQSLNLKILEAHR